MVDPTLTSGGKTFLTSSTAVLTLYNVQTEATKKSAGLIRVSMPVLSGANTPVSTNADSNSAIMADLLGNSRDFHLEGRFTTQDISHAYKFVRDLASIGATDPQTLIYGQGDTQVTPNPLSPKVGYTYTPVALNLSSTGLITGTAQSTTTVYVNDVNVTLTAGEPNTVNYSLTLYEGSGVYSF